MTTTKSLIAVVCSIALLPAGGADAQQTNDLAPILKGETMPDPIKPPPIAAARKAPPKARGDVHEGAEALQKKIAQGYSMDHPAYAIAAQNAARKGKGR